MPLRSFTEGADEIEVEGRTVGEALEALGRRHAGLLERILDVDGSVRRFVNIYIGEVDIRERGGLEASLQEGAVVSIVPAVAGGSGARARDVKLADLRARIAQVSPQQAAERQARGAVLIDVREQEEIAAGSPPGAVRLGRGYLELRIEDVAPELDRPLLLLCDGGARSLFAAEDLIRLGYTDVASVAGGVTRWKQADLPLELPKVLDRDARERYSRHLLMPEVGEAGQLRLLDSAVLVVGAGGIGSPAAFYLAAAGVGRLGIVDHDRVERSNLQRQILHTDARVGTPKVDSARERLLALNPSLDVEAHALRLDSSNVERLLDGYDLVIDGSDNFATRYLVNDACVKLGLPNVHGAVFRFEGQVSVFWPAAPNTAGPCYRCIYPEPPPPELAPSCAEAGVLGVLPGVIGLLQAVEAIKLLLGRGEPLIGRMLYYDALRARFSELQLKPNPDCPYCAEGAEFPGYSDYTGSCAVGC